MPSMPCRLQPYIWISDDALARAYRRFARTCQAHTRRHGSSVPGPLEARKRQAKRRMVGMAMSPAPSLLPDVASLFGSDGLDFGSLWKAPVPTNVPPPAPNIYNTLAPDPPHSPRPSLSVEDYRCMLGSCSDLVSVAESYATLHGDGELPVHFSKAAFTCLLESSTTDELLAFLQSDLNHEDAANTHAYLLHLCRVDFCPTAFSNYVNLVCDKIVLGTIAESELVHIIHDLPKTLISDAELPERETALVSACDSLRLSFADAYGPETPPSTLTTELFRVLCSLSSHPDVTDSIFAVYAWLPLSVQPSAVRSLSNYLYVQVERQTRHLDNPLTLTSIISSLPSHHASQIISTATLKFLDFLESSDPDASTSKLLCWLHCLRENARDMIYPLSPAADIIYPRIASRYSMSQLSHHFNSSSGAHAATAMLHYWIKPVILGASESPRAFLRRRADRASPFIHYGATYTISRPPNQSRSPSAERFGRSSTALANRIGRNIDFQQAALVHLFSVLSLNKIEYSHWLDETFRILIDFKSPTLIYNFARNLVKYRVPIPSAVSVRVIQFCLDSRKPSWALELFDRLGHHNRISTVPELVFALIEAYPLKSEFLFKLLNQPEYSNSLSMNLRQKPKNALSTERVNLIHQIAYALAKSPHMTARMAFRRVNDCLTYLMDRNAPLTNLMSRALVISGVTRPLSEDRWLSTDQFTWVLEHVRKLEGEEVAQKLDTMAWNLRSANESVRRANTKKLQAMYHEIDLQAWQFRKTLGHRSHRWKRSEKLFKPRAPKRRDTV